MEATMTIGEFAQQTGLSISALRFYADRGLLEPASIDPDSNYRRYSADQLEEGCLVRDLRKLEMPLAQISQLLSSDGENRSTLIADHVRSLETAVHRAHVIAQELGAVTAQELGAVTAQELGAEPTSEDTTMHDDHDTRSATIDAGELAAALRQVLPAASTDPERPHLMGVLVEATGSSLRIVATDGHRLAVRDLVPTTITDPFAAVVAATTLTGWMGGLDDLNAATIELTGKRVRMLPGTPGAEALPIEFPDYERYLVTDDRATTVLARRDELLDALDQFTGTGPVSVDLDPSKDSMALRRGDAAVDVAGTTAGKATTFAIDPTFMRQAAASAIGPEVAIEADDEASPVLFRSANDGTYTSLVMPFLV